MIRRFLTLTGHKQKLNDVYHCYLESTDEVKNPRIFCHFLGDLQDRDDSELYTHGPYGHLKKYSIENIGEQLARHFPGTDILVFQPTTFLHYRSFYSNFVKMNIDDPGSIPEFTITPDCYLHFECLIEDFLKTHPKLQNKRPLDVSICGFSSGGILLNQMIHSLHALRETPEFSSRIRIREWYFLDIGSNLIHGNYLLFKNLVEPVELKNCDVTVNIGLTDFQTSYKDRPSYNKEVEQFEAILRNLENVLIKKVHLPSSNEKVEQNMKDCDYLALHFSMYDALFSGAFTL